MAYTINRTDGSILATVADGTIDASTDLTLIGKNYGGYGEILNENYVKLLENFANSSAPSNPISGQIWWDSANNLLKVYTGNTFKTVSSSTASSTAPASNVTGDLWWDTANNQLKVFNGSNFTLIGPAFTAGSGQSGASIETITDNLGIEHVVVKMFVSDALVAIISKDATFTPQSSIVGFATVKQGYNLNSSLADAKFHGTAVNSDSLGGVAASGYIRSNANDTTTGTLSILNDSGLQIGQDNDFKVSVSGSNVLISNQTTDGDLIFRVNDNGSTVTALTIDGGTNRMLVAGDPTAALGVATKQYVDSKVSSSGSLLTTGGTMSGNILSANGTQNIGSATVKFNSIYATTFNGTSTSAQYADLAERFEADAVYEPGTVVAIGGEKEITRQDAELSDTVLGVVSTDPAYLMNNHTTSEYFPPIAMSGRVPVKVIGPVSKGDRLVSAGNGCARKANADELTPFNTIGRALHDKTSTEVGLVEAVVTIK
jgi:hypothetical protein